MAGISQAHVELALDLIESKWGEACKIVAQLLHQNGRQTVQDICTRIERAPSGPFINVQAVHVDIDPEKNRLAHRSTIRDMVIKSFVVLYMHRIAREERFKNNIQVKKKKKKKTSEEHLVEEALFYFSLNDALLLGYHGIYLQIIRQSFGIFSQLVLEVILLRGFGTREQFIDVVEIFLQDPKSSDYFEPSQHVASETILRNLPREKRAQMIEMEIEKLIRNGILICILESTGASSSTTATTSSSIQSGSNGFYSDEEEMELEVSKPLKKKSRKSKGNNEENDDVAYGKMASLPGQVDGELNLSPIEQGLTLLPCVPKMHVSNGELKLPHATNVINEQSESTIKVKKEVRKGEEEEGEEEEEEEDDDDDDETESVLSSDQTSTRKKAFSPIPKPAARENQSLSSSSKPTSTTNAFSPPSDTEVAKFYTENKTRIRNDHSTYVVHDSFFIRAMVFRFLSAYAYMSSDQSIAHQLPYKIYIEILAVISPLRKGEVYHLPSESNIFPSIAVFRIMKSRIMDWFNCSEIEAKRLFIRSLLSIPDPLITLWRENSNTKEEFLFPFIMLDFERALYELRVREYLVYVEGRYGLEALRIVNGLMRNGILEEKEISRIAGKEPKDVRKILFELFKNRLVVRSEVPRRADHQPNKVITLFSVNHAEFDVTLRQMAHFAILNIRERLRLTIQDERNIQLENDYKGFFLNQDVQGNLQQQQQQQSSSLTTKSATSSTFDAANVTKQNYQNYLLALEYLHGSEDILLNTCLLFSGILCDHGIIGREMKLSFGQDILVFHPRKSIMFCSEHGSLIPYDENHFLTDNLIIKSLVDYASIHSDDDDDENENP